MSYGWPAGPFGCEGGCILYMEGQMYSAQHLDRLTELAGFIMSVLFDDLHEYEQLVGSKKPVHDA